jgi:hypothetical protein
VKGQAANAVGWSDDDGGVSRWKNEEKKLAPDSLGGGLGQADALYDSQRFSHLKLTGFPFV